MTAHITAPAVSAGPLAERVRGLQSSPTSALRQRVKARRAAGERIIAFDAGELDHPTPPHVVEAAARAALDAEHHRYTPTAGQPALRAAVADDATIAGRTVSPEGVLVTTGAKQAALHAIMALVDPGDEVLLPAPCWVSYPAMASLAGGVPRLVPTTVDAGLKVTPDDLDRAYTPATKLLVLVNPGNPSGAVYDADELAALGEWCCQRGVWVLADEVYRRLVYGRSFTPFLQAAPECADRCAVIDGVSKAYAMSGWRVGWLIGHEPLIRAATALQSHSTSHASNVSQAAALAALRGPDDVVRATVAVLDARRRALHGALCAVDGVRCPEPDGAFYVFPDVSAYGDDRDVAGWLLDSGVSTVPGSAFGAPGHLRFSYALSDADLRTGAELLAAAFAARG